MGGIGFLLLLLDFLHRSHAAGYFLCRLLDFFPGKCGCAVIFGFPAPYGVRALYLQPVICLRLKSLLLCLALGNHGEGRRLHAAAGKLRVVLDRQRPGGVQAHQPVCLRPGDGSLVQLLVFTGVLELGKALADGLVGHRRNPQALHGLLYASFLDNPAGY